MADEHLKQPVTVSRDQLYNQVWQTPMSRLAVQYGISGDGLAKICDRPEGVSSLNWKLLCNIKLL